MCCSKHSNEGESEQQNPVAVVQFKLREVETKFRRWLKKQPLPVEAAVATVTGGARGAAIGALIRVASSLITPPTSSNPQALAISARNGAVMCGVQNGVHRVMKRLRGKEDVQSAMVEGFCGGVSYSLVSGDGIWGPNQHATNAVTSGLLLGLILGGFCQLLKKSSPPPEKDLYYSETRWMLSHLGLQNYEKNFKKGLLTDRTLPLLTESALSDVKIPPGPRLLILDHINRDPEMKDRRKALIEVRAQGSSRLKY